MSSPKPLSTPPTSLKVCVYGSSSNLTPQAYLDAAHELGALLARRGHVCVNGGGKFGCMGSLNDGASSATGKITAIIHSMFLTDGEEYYTPSHPNISNITLIVATGPDLTERKRFLVSGCDCIIVLPGGTGTFDEMWEMGCLKNLGLFTKPIVCLSVDGYYDDFERMMERARREKLMREDSSDVVVFKANANDAVDYCERVYGGDKERCMDGEGVKLKTSENTMKMKAEEGVVGNGGEAKIEAKEKESYLTSLGTWAMVFGIGVYVGSIVSRRK